jgi:hypothetical protein
MSLPAAPTALWADTASSQLAAAMESQAQGWTCGAIPASDPLNKLAVSCQGCRTQLMISSLYNVMRVLSPADVLSAQPLPPQ